MIGRELELHQAAEALAGALADDEREYLQERAKEGGYAIQFASNGWFYRHELDRPWTPEMEAYRRALSDLQDFRLDCYNERSPLDPSASGRRMSTYEWIAARGD